MEAGGQKIPRLLNAVARQLLFAALAVGAARAADVKDVDGFKVRLLQFPHVAHLHLPSYIGPPVTFTAHGPGTSPYRGTPLEGSRFMSIGAGGAAYYDMHYMQNLPRTISLVWGTPDPGNTLLLYDHKNRFIGDVTGGDLLHAFHLAKGYYQIRSPRPIGLMVFYAATCCFESGNQGRR